ncbi:hypothetical protein SAMN05216559_4126 [Halomicrobium zhouii]|uniref:Uncharacterized protein n=1 Tax=Halomicrobium zhouii TaxID=767519 RepID=A0A1I6MAU9_9EURY|nr:hypothetical protein [Halomicrobium zhouii]SFS12781.1 hypothetical protein SAMN05216559_4126 [Halomicrobium zhouii]
MKTCLSDDHPVWSLLVGGFWIAIGTVWLALWNIGGPQEPLAWLHSLIALVSYGFALYTLRYGVSHRPKRVVKLFEPRWLADDRE